MTETQTGKSVAANPLDEDTTGLPAQIKPTPELVQQMRAAILDGKLPPEVGDPAITARLIRARILDGSFDESMQPAESLPSWRDEYTDENVTVLGFHLVPSAFKDEAAKSGVAAYAVVELMTPETGELVTVQTGGGNVLAQLIKAWEEERFPFQAVLRQKPTGTPGRSVLWLEKVAA